MSRSHRISLLGCAAVTLALTPIIPSVSAGAQTSRDAGVAQAEHTRLHVQMSTATRPAQRSASVPAPYVHYYGGPVISNLDSIDVSWGSSSFISPGNPGASVIPAFTSQYLGSGVLNWLSEYDTTVSGGTDQSIGPGTSGGVITITPTLSSAASTITDTQIQAELTAQIASGALPTPSATSTTDTSDMSFALFFPSGQQICFTSGQCSLVSGGFCAYHWAMEYDGVWFTYQVVPDLAGANDTGCGDSGDLRNTTIVLSHELAETITDPFGVSSSSPGLAWIDPNYGEIADLCEGLVSSFVGWDGVSYTVQPLFKDSFSSKLPSGCLLASADTASLALSVGTKKPVAGLPITVNVAVTGTSYPIKSLTPTGNVIVSDGSTSCVATVTGGSGLSKGTCAISDPQGGSNTFTATYEGSPYFPTAKSPPVAVTVVKITTKTTISPIPPTTKGTATPITVTVTSGLLAQGPTPTGNVTISLGSQSCVASLGGSGGIATGTCSLAPTSIGTVAVSATYPGSTTFTSSMAKAAKLKVNA